MPNDEDLAQFVSKVQKHKQLADGMTDVGFIILCPLVCTASFAREHTPDMCSDDKAHDAQLAPNKKIENTDILGGYINFKGKVYDQMSDILVNEQKYSQNPSHLEYVVGQLNEHGPPQHAWDQVAT